MEANISIVSSCKVLVIGAGAAGLGAAEYLLRHGVRDLLVLEGSERIGGRISTASFGSNAEHIIELGANWIHGGTVANPFFTAAIQHNFVEADGSVPVLDRFRNCSFGKTDGKLLEQQLGQRAIDAFFKAERAAYALYFRSSNQDTNLLEYLNAQLEALLESEFPPEEREDVRCAFNAMRNYLKFHTSDDLHKLSAKFYGTFQEIPGNDVMVPGGFLNLLATFSDAFPAGTVRFNRHVTEIRWDGKHVSVSCADGSAYRAQHVILTSSLGYLKQHNKTLFNPPLPVFKQKAIEKIGYGSTNKIFLEFSPPFWKSGMLGCVAMGWSDDEASAPGEAGWEKAVYGFDEVYNNPHVLVGWVAGDASRDMERASDRDVVRVCTRLLRRFTGNPNIPEPKRVWRTRWCAEPFALGSYSYATNRSGSKEIRDLARPLPSERSPALLFAGEATHDNYYSTVHGALLSGIREARRIVDLEKVSKL